MSNVVFMMHVIYRIHHVCNFIFGALKVTAEMHYAKISCMYCIHVHVIWCMILIA